MYFIAHVHVFCTYKCYNKFYKIMYNLDVLFKDENDVLM
jgi:hypothetical protein